MVGTVNDVICWVQNLPRASASHLPPQRVTAGLQSGQWGRKKAAAAALSQICATSGDTLEPHLPAVLDALLKVRGMPALVLGGAVVGRLCCCWVLL